jgi:hypothetical protein
MRHIHTEIEIGSSAQRVWDILADLQAYAEWNPLIREAKGTLQPGGRLHLWISAPGLAQRRVPVQLLTVTPARELRWLGRLGFPRVLDGDHSFLLTPLGTDRVRVVQQESFSGICVPFAAPWLMPNMTRGFEAMNAALKQRAESAAPPAV